MSTPHDTLAKPDTSVIGIQQRWGSNCDSATGSAAALIAEGAPETCSENTALKLSIIAQGPPQRFSRCFGMIERRNKARKIAFRESNAHLAVHHDLRPPGQRGFRAVGDGLPEERSRLLGLALDMYAYTTTQTGTWSRRRFVVGRALHVHVPTSHTNCRV